MASRYILYGYKPAEHNNNNSDTNPHHQKLGDCVPVYETEDRDEAKKLVKEGGFISEDKGYVVIQGAKDTKSGGTIGLVP